MNDPAHTSVEIITYRLRPGIAPDEHATRARAAAVHRCPGFLRRDLSCDDDGLWTDHVLWASLEQARAAAASIMDVPGFAAFAADIEGDSVILRHAAHRIAMAP